MTRLVNVCELAKAVRGYSKVLDGNFFAMEIGLEKLRKHCCHFNEWIERLAVKH